MESALQIGLRIDDMDYHMATPIMNALENLNRFGLREMSMKRVPEMKALASPMFRNLIGLKRIHLTTYHDVIRAAGRKV